MKPFLSTRFFRCITTAAVFLFCLQAVAQEEPADTGRQYLLPAPYGLQPWAGIPVGSTKEGVSRALLSEYQNLEYKYSTPYETWWKDVQRNITGTDRKRMETIFRKMSRKQQSAQHVVFVDPPQPLRRQHPSRKQLDLWKDPSRYGVWIDGKKVSNDILNRYSHTDFAQVVTSRLYGTAKARVPYAVQVDLMTNTYYQHYYAQTIAEAATRMVFR